MKNTTTSATRLNKKQLAAARKNLINLRETIGLRGVTIENIANPTNPFRARLKFQGQDFSLGYYNDPMQAALAYNKKAKSIFRTVKQAKAAGYWNEIGA